MKNERIKLVTHSFSSTSCYWRTTLLTFVFVQVTYGLLVGEDDGLVLCDDLPAQVLPAWGQLPQFLQLAHSATSHGNRYDLAVQLAH